MINIVAIVLEREIVLAFFLAAVSLVVCYIAWRFGYFKISHATIFSNNLKASHLITVFILYFLSSNLLTPIFFHLLQIVSKNSELDLVLLGWANIISLSLTATILFWYYQRCLQKYKVQLGLTIDKKFFHHFLFGIASWLIATPVVLFFNQMLDLFIYVVIKAKEIPEQIAVSYIKSTMDHSLLFFLAIFAVVILAPFIEELVFRGFLQSFFKKVLGAKFAIVLASIIFAFFHFSMSQGVGNITIIGSLFLLGCFFGFVYERQKSLITPITLHAAFNLMSVFNLMLQN